MFKRIVAIILIISLLMSIAGCGKVPQENTPDDELTYDELVKLARADGELVVYSISTRISSAARAFEEKYGIKVRDYSLKDGELISRVATEVGGGIQGADVVLAQDSGRVQLELIDTGYLVNYVPLSMENIIEEQDKSPLVCQYINKVFSFSSETNTLPPIDNAWDLCEKKFKNLVQFKNPLRENVNMNFLTMITSKDWSKKLEDAYEKNYGKKLVLTDGNKNAGYEWISRFLENATLELSDTIISEQIGDKNNKNQLVGLFAYTKMRYEESKNLSMLPMCDVEPFSGFLYPAYVMMTSNAKHSYASRLFIEYLLTEEGFTPWSKDVGAYSTNPNVAFNKNDYPLEFWKSRLVVEDPIFLAQNLSDVTEFVDVKIKAKG
ncbi:MAG: ABC transporter substrate-binding protein [Clostridia bacterium]